MTVDGEVRNIEVDIDVGSPSVSRLPRVLLTIILVALVATGTSLGYLWGHHGSSGMVATPSTTSVDAGFARDMATHHQQAITMAGYVRDNTSNPTVKILAYDIETSQYFQVGQMQGWLDAWGLPRGYPTQMLWMAGHSHLESDGLMPGMATPAQVTQLESMHGNALDVFFLQLMIHHHQGGLPMAQYAVDHASEPYVKLMAESIVASQSSEIISMEQLLRQLGGSPLPEPAN